MVESTRKIAILIWAIMLFILATPFSAYSQEENLEERIEIEVLEGTIKQIYGTEKLDALLKLSEYYTYSNGRKSTRYARQALAMAKDIFDGREDPNHYLDRTHFQVAVAYYNYQKYYDAREAFDQALSFSQNTGYQIVINESNAYLQKIDSLVAAGKAGKRNIISQSLKSLELKERVSRTKLDWSITNKLNIAKSHEKKYEYPEAIKNYEEAINLLKNKGDDQTIDELQAKIMELERLDALDEKVIDLYDEAIAEQEEIVMSLGGVTSKDSIIQEQAEKKEVTSIVLEKNEDALGQLIQQSDSLKTLAKKSENSRDYKAAENFRLLSAQVEAEIKKREDAELQLTMLMQQKQLAEADLRTKNLQLEAQDQMRKNIILGLALVFSLAIALAALYFTKKRDHQKLSAAYVVLEETKTKLAVAEENIRKLLTQQVSEDIAAELMDKGTTLTTKKRFVCIMFLDIREFTPWAEKHSAEEIIEYQNKVFGFMIDIVNKYHGNVNQLLGDGFMATFGAPRSNGNDCQNAFDAAQLIIQKLNDYNANSNIDNTRIGIGLHAGHVVTGNVGTEYRKQYSITGNTVILASRIEQLNKKYDSQLIISREVFEKLEHYNGKQVFDEVLVKGRQSPIEILTVI